jgi:hypothetical protein
VLAAANNTTTPAHRLGIRVLWASASHTLDGA